MSVTGLWSNLALSPDRRRVALSLRQGPSVHLWTYDLERGTRTRLLTDVEVVANPTWSPDGRRLFLSSFFGNRTWHVHQVPTGQPAPAKRVLLGSDEFQWPCDVSPDGRWLVYAQGQIGQTDLWTAPLSGSEAPRALVRTPARDVDAKFSPDGRWLAYTSDASGRFEIYLRPFLEDADPVQISASGGTTPVWSPDGRELFYRSAADLMAVTLSRTPTGLQPSTERRLFSLAHASVGGAFGVSADGNRFVFVRSSAERLSVVLNWSPQAGDDQRGRP